MRAILLTLAGLAVVFANTGAGPNADGAIIVHTNDSYAYNSLTVCTTTLGQPASCAAAVTRTDKVAAAVVWFLAAFRPTASPAVASIYFGINFDDVNLDPTTRFAPCGPAGTVEAPDAGWPSNQAGNSMGFGSPIVGNILFRFYYFKADDMSDGVASPYLCSAINPTGGFAAFYSNQFPPAEDYIEKFGCVRWYAQGSNDCPYPLEGSACCDPATGVCLYLEEVDCLPPAVWHPEWPSCSPNPCPQPLAACCAIDGGCSITVPSDCYPPSTWHSGWPSCSPNPCSPAAACCDPATGACNLIPELSCLAPSIWHADWPACVPNPCPQPVAVCCSINGDCTLTVSADCPAPSTWHAEWTTCTPDPCTSILLGACCDRPTGRCTLLAEAQCHPPSVWHPEWTSCTPNPCPVLGPPDFPPGSNPNGAIIVHTNDSYNYLSTTVCTTTLGQPTGCAEAITRTDKATAAVVWLLASFLPMASPAVASVYFGINYDDTALDVTPKFGPCGPPGTVEAPDDGWPGDMTAGNSVGFGWPIIGNTLFRFYYFKVDDTVGEIGPFLCSAINPTGGFAAFFDNSFPPGGNEITEFGCVRWYDAGLNHCPTIQLDRGACCLVTGECLFIEQAQCAGLPGFISWTVNQPCVPDNPCAQPGACCDLETGACEFTLQANCIAPRVFVGGECLPVNPCPRKGACCEPVTGVCTYVLQAQCVAPSVWHPEWACNPSNCPVEPMGACCAPNGDCTYVYAGQCLPPSVWHSEWTCVHNGCPPPIPTESSSWGKIKAVFR
jgi:hypothetical protein